ncbi:uncharacterized protein CCDC197 [Notamacropus eugenii]|uniref:uncharacterized protein CCDC197 n=1 Tax=Notamacropus eugenii TaxID=9315 RepID=UPI003B674F25
MHEAGVRQKKYKNAISSSENRTMEEKKKHENTPVQAYENLQTSRPLNTVSTLQNALVLNAQIMTNDELVQMNKMLEAKKQEWKKRMEIVTKRKTELLKGQKYRNQLMNKFLKESKAKKQQAMERWAADLKANKIKQEEIERLSQELRDLHTRKQKMKKKMESYRPFEDFLVKVLDLPNYFRSWNLNSSIKKIMDHYEMLSKINKNLIKQVSSLSDAHKKAQKNLEALQLEYTNSTLALNTELSTLQKKLDEVKEKNKEMKMNVEMKKGSTKSEDQDLGRIVTVITNLANRCQIQHYGPVKCMDLGCKLEMIQEFILDKRKTKKLAESRMFWNGKPIESYPQKIQGPGKRKLTDRISSRASPGVLLSKITVPQTELAIKLPISQAHCLKPLNLPKSQEVQQPCFSFPQNLRCRVSPYASKA